jgi:hypothetical protein
MIIISNDKIFTVDYWFIHNTTFVSSTNTFCFFGLKKSVNNDKEETVPIHDIKDLTLQLNTHPDYLDLRTI